LTTSHTKNVKQKPSDSQSSSFNNKSIRKTVTMKERKGSVLLTLPNYNENERRKSGVGSAMLRIHTAKKTQRKEESPTNLLTP
jgi:hypothetical protein